MIRILCFFLMLLAMDARAQGDLLLINSQDKTFSARYPKGWSAKAEKYGQNSFININAPGQDGIKVSIARSPLPPNVKSLDELVAAQIKGIKQEMEVTTFSENKRLGNKHVLVFDFNASGKKVKMKFYFWLENNMAYSASIAAEILEYMANLGEAEAIVKSIGPAGEEKSATAGSAAAGALVDVDCSKFPEFSTLIARAPAGIMATERFGRLRLTNNKDFQVEVSRGSDFSLESEMKGVRENDVNKLKKLILEEPNGVIYHSEVMSSRPEYHFKFILRTGNGAFLFQDTKGPQHDLNAIKLMYQAAKESRLKGSAGATDQGSATQSAAAKSSSAVEKAGAKEVATAVLETAPALSNNRGVAAAGTVAAGAIGKLGSKKEKNDNEGASPASISANERPENGPYEGRDEAGNLIEKGQFSNGKKTGKWTRYTKGIVTSEIEYKNGEKHGKRIEYFDNGNKQYEENYNEGKLDGIRQRYDLTEKTVVEIWNYKNGKMDGAYKKLTSKGVVIEEGSYLDGKKEGMWKYYERDGTLKNSKMFKDGKAE